MRSVLGSTIRSEERASGPEQAGALVPAYYWAGSGSALVHRLKGFDREVDGEAYRRAYDEDRLRWLRDAIGVNLVFLSYNWGLPPEVERSDWEGFRVAAQRAHDAGMRVAAYVQPSNAVAIGSYESRDWYAVTPKGKRIPYYNGRFFTCLNNPAWRATVFERVRGALADGADAIFLDNCAFGGMPIPLSRDYTAFAGCFCGHCHTSFGAWRAARGHPIEGVPRLFRPQRDPVAREFAHWRAWTLTSFLREIKALIDAERPGAWLLTNTVGAVSVNTYHIFGVDLPELAHVVDALFVENLQSPRAEPGLLVQNAGTFKLLQSLKPGAAMLSISYERGIGVDGVPPRATFERTMAEGYAAGGVPVVRAAEYIEDRRWTMLQPGLHDDQAAGARTIVAFVRGHPEIFGGTTNAAAVAVLVPQGLAWRGDAFPERGADYLGVIQALVGAAVPFRVVTAVGQAGDAKVLLVPEGVPLPAFRGAVLRYADLGVYRKRRSLFDYFTAPLEPVMRVAGPRVVDGYYSRVHVRRFVDRLDLLFRLAFRDQFEPLAMDRGLARLLRGLTPCSAEAQTPIYTDLWENEAGLHLHIVNYGSEPAVVQLRTAIGPPTSAKSPSGPVTITAGRMCVDRYVVLSWDGYGRNGGADVEARCR
ncbi:MAG: hypothetical protein ACKVVT_09445 [Dehalococcoidia bacterium]